MTCRDIIIKELKRLGADGLYNEKLGCDCKVSFFCPWDDDSCDLSACIIGKQINGKWEAVEVWKQIDVPPIQTKPDNVSYPLNFTEYPLNNTISVEDKEYCEWQYEDGTFKTTCGKTVIFMDRDYKYCPYCQLEIKEVAHD